MPYVMLKGTVAMVVPTIGFKEFFQTQGYKPCLSVSGQHTYISRDGTETEVRYGEDEIKKFVKNPDSYFKFPRGVREFVLNDYKNHFTQEQLVKLFSTEGKRILSTVLGLWITESEEQKYRDVFERMTDKDLLKLWKKYDVTQTWLSYGVEHLAKLYPRRILPLLVNASSSIAQRVIEKRLRSDV
jgi:hypothetical protein